MTEEFQTFERSEETRLEATRRNLETRQDIVGESYRTIRDNPKTSAAIATGVAAAAGAGAFLLNRKRKVGTAFGHASVSSEIENEVVANNRENLAKAKTKAPVA